MIKILKEINITDEKYWFLQIKLSEFKTIVSYYQNKIPVNNLYMGNDNNLGYELDPHITLLYGILSPELHDSGLTIPTICKLIFENFKPFEITLGNISKFNNKPEYDVIKINIVSDILCTINRVCRDNLKNNQTYNDYKPHLTIAYVKPNSIDNLINTDWLDKKFTINEIILTSPEKINYQIKL